MCKEVETWMFEMRKALLACQQHPVHNGEESGLFSKHLNVKLFFLMDIFALWSLKAKWLGYLLLWMPLCV